MAIIDNTYFVKDIVLPNTDQTKAEGQYYISQTAIHEDQYIKDILGYEMGKDFLSAIASNPTTGVYYDLWKGAEYTDENGLLNKWPGFANSDKRSPIAYYVFTRILTQIQTQTSGVGVISLAPENASKTAMSRKYLSAWNEMVRLNWILHEFLYINRDDYPDYIGINYPPVLQIGLSNVGKMSNQRFYQPKDNFGI